ncbi:MAG: S4 domain-containing protein, partial [Ktedonobacteraceae bacterium]
MAANKERLDSALVRRGLAPSRERAQALVMAGQIYIRTSAGERRMEKPGMLVPHDADLYVAGPTPELKYA